MLAFSLARSDVREFDQTITFFSETEGKKTCLARGVKKIISKNSAFLEPFSLLEIETVSGKEIDYLTKVYPVFISFAVWKNIRALELIQKSAATVLLLVSDGERDDKLFYFLQQYVLFLDKTEDVHENIWFVFLLKFLVVLGFKPVLTHCVVGERCDLAKEVFFSCSLGGVVCVEHFKLSKDTPTKITQLDRQQLEKMSKSTWEEKYDVSTNVQQIVARFGQYYTGKIFA